MNRNRKILLSGVLVICVLIIFIGTIGSKENEAKLFDEENEKIARITYTESGLVYECEESYRCFVDTVIFEKNVYTVNFYDGDQLISTQEITSGESAKAPVITKEGFVLSWDTDFSNVKKDLNVKAVWKDYVEVPLPENNTVSKEAFAEILAQNATMDIVVKSNNNVTFTFGKGTMQAVEGKESYDFTTTVQNTYSESLPAYVKAETFVMVINYSYSGELPAEASIRLLVGKDYAGQTLYYSWMKDDGTFAETQSAVADADGYITVKQDHCSSYVVTTEAPTLPETDNNNTNTTPGTDNNNQKPSSPPGGDKDMSVAYMLMFVSMFVAVVVFKKNKNIVR